MKDYEFQLVQNEVKKGEAIIAVRLVNKKTGKTVPDAVIFAKRIDMAPDRDGGDGSRIEPVPATEPGVYASRPISRWGPLAAVARRQGSGRDRHGRKQAGPQGHAMSRGCRTDPVLAAVLAAGTGGYWLAQERAGVLTIGRRASQRRNRAGPSSIIRTPTVSRPIRPSRRRPPDGRPYRAVCASEDVSFDEPEAASGDERAGRPEDSLLPQPDGSCRTSPAPKKDSMGMDYIAVYEGEDDDSTTVKVSAGQDPAHRR